MFIYLFYTIIISIIYGVAEKSKALNINSSPERAKKKKKGFKTNKGNCKCSQRKGKGIYNHVVVFYLIRTTDTQ